MQESVSEQEILIKPSRPKIQIRKYKRLGQTRMKHARITQRIKDFSKT